MNGETYVYESSQPQLKTSHKYMTMNIIANDLKKKSSSYNNRNIMNDSKETLDFSESNDETLTAASGDSSISQLLDELEKDMVQWKRNIGDMRVNIRRVKRKIDDKKVPSWSFIV